MDDKKRQSGSQIFDIPRIAYPRGTIDNFRYFYSRIKRFTKRRLIYIKNWFLEIFNKTNSNAHDTTTVSASVKQLQTGDFVRVRSKKEVQSTLDRWNSLNGCTFLEEMWPYCGTTQRVLKQVKRFLDERDYRIKRTKGIVLLEGVICAGSADFGKCDRSCFFFWREEWLEKLD